MPTFIDESGDPGFKPGRSDHFQLCAVTVHTANVAEEMRQAIHQLKLDLTIPIDREFKFSETGSLPERRAAFFDLCLQFPWHFAAAAVEKRHINHGDQSNATCYEYASTAIAVLLRPEYKARWLADQHGYRKETVVVDENKDRSYLAALSGAFRPLGCAEVPAVTLVGKVKFDDGQSEVLLQLADMLCGAVYDSLGGNDTWLDRVKSRQLSTTWCLPNMVEKRK
jgi:hypothetical protein